MAFFKAAREQHSTKSANVHSEQSKRTPALIRRGKFFYGKYSNVETGAPEQFFPYRSGLGVGSGTSARGDATGAGIGGGA